MIQSSSRPASGFTLLEVLVALIIISIGVLGIAAIQAAALSSTHTSQTESIVAIQARSMADAMEANTAYWGSGGASASMTVTPSSSVGGVFNPSIAAGSCAGAVCTASQMAGYDLNQWAGQLYSQVPGSSAVIACSGSPVSCTITVTWPQKVSTSINSGTASSPGTPTTTTMSYTLVNQL